MGTSQLTGESKMANVRWAYVWRENCDLQKNDALPLLMFDEGQENCLVDDVKIK